MTHEEIMSAVAAGAGAGRRGRELWDRHYSSYPSDLEISLFCRRLLLTLGELPEDMTIAELIERLEEIPQ